MPTPIKKIDLLREYRRFVRETGDAETAVAALAATPFVVPLDLDASDVGDFADFDAFALLASAKRGTDVIEIRENRERLLRALIARNPYAGGAPTRGNVATRRLSATIPGDVLDALDALAAATGSTRSALVTDALEAYFAASDAVASVARDRDALADDAAFDSAANVGRFFEVCAAVVDAAGTPSIRNRAHRAKRRPADEFYQLAPRVTRAFAVSADARRLKQRFEEIARVVGLWYSLPDRLSEREQQAFDAGAAREKKALATLISAKIGACDGRRNEKTRNKRP